MAFKSKDLNVLAYANGFTQWHYVTDDAMIHIVNGSKYFTTDKNLKVNDMIIINAYRNENTIVFVTLVDGNYVDIKEVGK
tara:strand:+ start:14462 stop:14701 length:240 start_codon:yes stop_codon:yes gene_type:complete